MASDVHSPLTPYDVTNCWLVKVKVKDYIKHHQLKAFNDIYFNAFDHGFVIAACKFANIQQLKNQKQLYQHKGLSTTPLELVASYSAMSCLNIYLQKNPTAPQEIQKCFTAGYLAAYYLFT